MLQREIQHVSPCGFHVLNVRPVAPRCFLCPTIPFPINFGSFINNKIRFLNLELINKYEKSTNM